MKRIIAGMFTAVLLLTVGGAARAEEGAGTEVEAGIKWWCNKWKQRSELGTVRSERSPLIGPAVEAKFHNGIFVEGSYLQSGWDYKFDDALGTVKLDRRDLDLAAGYMVLRNVGVFAGYRNSVMKENGTGVKETVYGSLLGVRGSVSLSEAVSLYGSYTALLNRFKEEAVETSRERSPGWAAEAGAKYAFSKHVSASLGVKYETTKGMATHVRDSFLGWVLGAMYAFE